MEPEEIEAHRESILAIEAAQDLCKGCDGTNCKQQNRGIYEAIEPEGGRFYVAVAMCKYEKNRRQQQKMNRLFASARVPLAYQSVRFRNYQLTEDNRNAVAAAKWATGAENTRGLFIYGPRGTGKTIYVLDEPTTGLHFEDVRKLVKILRELSDSGNTVVVIEHNLDVIKTADYIIDLGPEGGDGGGTVIAQGTPEEICKVKKSYTGQYLKKYLK